MAKVLWGVRNAAMSICRIRDIQGELVQGVVSQLTNAVDRKLIQNDQRSETQEGMIKGIYTTMRELIGG